MKKESLKATPRRKGHFADPELDRRFHALWESLKKGHPFQGMTTKEILTKIRQS